MSHDDNRNDNRDRGAYTPPTDDDLPFNRNAGFDARRAPPTKAPPVTLIISGAVLLAMIIAVVVIYNLSGPKPSQDAPSLGTPVTNLRVEAPVDAQPVDAEAGINVYRNQGEAPTTGPTYTAPPEEAQPRPAPRPLPPVAVTPAPKAAPVAAAAPAPAPRPAAPVATAPAPAPTAALATATGTSAVQIGAFSSTAVADREFAAVAARFPQFSQGSAKRVQEVTAANGSTVYRTTFTGLSRERAQAFCAAIRARGSDCLVR